VADSGEVANLTDDGAGDPEPNLRELALDALRTLRREAEQEEQELSFVRRLLHGRIDILKAEFKRRSGEGGDLMSSLSEILADRSTGSAKPSPGRYLSLDSPLRENQTAKAAESAIAEFTSSDIGSVDDTKLNEILESLIAHERTVSDARAVVHKQIDLLSGELTRRYCEGTAQVDDLLAAARRQ
jgi:hypothetical protein